MLLQRRCCVSVSSGFVCTDDTGAERRGEVVWSSDHCGPTSRPRHCCETAWQSTQHHDESSRSLGQRCARVRYISHSAKYCFEICRNCKIMSVTVVTVFMYCTNLEPCARFRSCRIGSIRLLFSRTSAVIGWEGKIRLLQLWSDWLARSSQKWPVVC